MYEKATGAEADNVYLPGSELVLVGDGASRLCSKAEHGPAAASQITLAMEPSRLRRKGRNAWRTGMSSIKATSPNCRKGSILTATCMVQNLLTSRRM
jgi:hypothetical protein